MAGWISHQGQMLALPLENIDTDQLIPARFMSVPRAQGYGDYLLHDMRFDAHGLPDPDIPLNRHPDASILVTRRNFGCGSSREAAVYALVDAGFHAVIAPGFGEIFAGNAVNNGLLPAQVTTNVSEQLIKVLTGQTKSARIDLETNMIAVQGQQFQFELDPVWRTKLIQGWDDIDLTLAETAQIEAFAERRRNSAPWVWPTQP